MVTALLTGLLLLRLYAGTRTSPPPIQDLDRVQRFATSRLEELWLHLNSVAEAATAPPDPSPTLLPSLSGVDAIAAVAGTAGPISSSDDDRSLHGKGTTVASHDHDRSSPSTASTFPRSPYATTASSVFSSPAAATSELRTSSSDVADREQLAHVAAVEAWLASLQGACDVVGGLPPAPCWDLVLCVAMAG